MLASWFLEPESSSGVSQENISVVEEVTPVSEESESVPDDEESFDSCAHPANINGTRVSKMRVRRIHVLVMVLVHVMSQRRESVAFREHFVWRLQKMRPESCMPIENQT